MSKFDEHLQEKKKKDRYTRYDFQNFDGERYHKQRKNTNDFLGKYLQNTYQ